MTANHLVESGGSSSEATARDAAIASIAANNVLAAANTAQRIATSQNASGTFQYSTAHYTKVHYFSLHCTSLQHPTLNYTVLYFTTPYLILFYLPC